MFVIDISKKVLIITLLIFAVLTAAFTLSHSMQNSNILELEHNDTLKKVERVQHAVSTEQDSIDYMVQDWACWDDTYEFIEDKNQNFIDVDLQNQTLAGIKVNVMVFVNNAGTIVYAKAVDIDTGEDKPVPKELLKMVENGTLLTKSENDTIKGFVLLDKDPMFISCHPILTTKSQGPSRGTLIFGRYFDQAILQDFKKVTQSSLLLYKADSKMPPDFQNKLEKFSVAPMSIIIEHPSKEKISGYFEFKDILGKPALILRADFPRDLYLSGEKTLDQMYLFLLLIGLMTGAGVKFAFDKLFVSRLSGIDKFVTKVRSEKDLSKRLPLNENDELYRLSREINGMLDEIFLTKQEYAKEQRLRSQEREMKVLLDSMSEMVLFLNPQYEIIWVNKVALEKMKMELQEAVGLYIKSFPGIGGSLSGNLQLEQIFTTGNKKSMEFITEDGSSWFVQEIPVNDENGKITGVMVTCRDITEKKVAEKLLKEKQIAEIANRTKSEFLANMSHELRTPLNSIIGFSDMLIEQAHGEWNEKQLRHVGNISKSGKQLLNLINAILDLSKIEAGKLELDYKEFELATKLNLIKNLMSPIADRKKIEIQIDVDSKINSIYADEERFLQIMYNLVDNAIKFSYENSVVKIGIRKKGNFVEVIVKDTGIGVNIDDQSKLFKPFSQIDSFYTKSSQGTGLGLSLVKQIVHMHGGYVWFKSNPEEGSTFAFAIPINPDKSIVLKPEKKS